MERVFGTSKLSVVSGDLLKSPDLDLIVNPANEALKGGVGMCGDIFKAAGWSSLKFACEGYLPDVRGVRCPVGESRTTPAFNLPNAGIVHSVCPIVSDEETPIFIADAYTSALDECARLGYASIGVSSMGPLPASEMADLAISACARWMTANRGSSVREVRMVFSLLGEGPGLRLHFLRSLTNLKES